MLDTSAERRPVGLNGLGSVLSALRLCRVNEDRVGVCGSLGGSKKV